MNKNRIIYFVAIIITLSFLGGCVLRQEQKATTLTQFAQNNIRDYLSRVAGEITDNALSDINTIEDWQNVRSHQYAEYTEMMGIQDYLKEERTDLNVKVTGSIQCDGYRIDKLYYESLPGLYVPANLYVPDGIESPTPAILYVCGHSYTQKVHYQPFPAKLAKLGFVCLIIETIQRGEVSGAHWGPYDKGWFNWYSRGYNPSGVELWNGIRAIDLLESLSEVDKNNIGVTGISGGGSQSWYIAAADQRIKAAAPVCGASTLKAQIGKRTIDGHCDCMMPINTYQADFHDIGALIAPRPLLIAQSNRDELNTIESVRGLYSDIKRIYGLYGNSEDVILVETPGRHSYHKKSRTAIHSFFLKTLMGKDISPEESGDIDTTKDNLLTAEELRVYVDGVPENDRTTKIQDSFIKLPDAPEITTDQELITYRDKVKEFLKIKTFGAFPEHEVPFDSSLYFRSVDYSNHEWDIYSFTSEEGWRLKVDLRWRNDKSENKPLMIVLKNFNQGRWESENLISDLNKDWNVAYLEVRGVGENGWDPSLQWHIRRASSWTGRTIASMQVYDLLRAIRFCRTIDGVDPSKIGIAASGGMSVVALYAALFDGNCFQLLLKNPPATQDVESNPEGKGGAIEMLNCLRTTDVYQLPALVAPTQTVFVGDVPESYNWSISLLNKLEEVK